MSSDADVIAKPSSEKARKSPLFDASTRHSVINGISEGSEAAWARFFEIYAPVVYRCAKQAKLSESEIEQVLSNVMCNMFVCVRNGFQVDREKGPFRAYFRTVVNRAIRDHIKKGGRSAEPTLEFDEGEADERFNQIERSEYLNHLLSHLELVSKASVRDIQVFRRVALDGHAPKDVAQEFGVSRGRVDAIKHEVIAELRKIREQLEAEQEG